MSTQYGPLPIYSDVHAPCGVFSSLPVRTTDDGAQVTCGRCRRYHRLPAPVPPETERDTTPSKETSDGR